MPKRIFITSLILITFFGMAFFISQAGATTTSTITVTSPNGGEEWEIDSQYSINWSWTGDIEEVNITLNKNDEYLKDLFTNLENTSSTSWTLGSDLEAGDDYKIKIVNATSTDVYDESDDYFSIVESTPTTTECLPDGTLIKLPGDPKIYVIIDCQKRWIKTVKEFKRHGYRWGDITEVSSPVIQAYADYMEATTTALLRPFGHHRVYRIVNGKRLWVPTISAFNAQGLKWEDIEDVDESEVNQYPQANLVKLPGSPKVFYLTNNGFKKHIPSVEVFNSYNNNWEDIVEISIDELDAYPDVVLIRSEDDYRVYKLENNQKRWVKTIQAFNRFGFNWGNVVIVNVTEINSYSEGNEIE